MTNEEVIKMLKELEELVEWQYDMRYSVAIDVAVKELENNIQKEKNHFGWIPITKRPITDEEREAYGWNESFAYLFTCPLPVPGDEILISMNNGKWVDRTIFCFDDYGAGDENGNDWINDVDAWMPMPKGYERRYKNE